MLDDDTGPLLTTGGLAELLDDLARRRPFTGLGVELDRLGEPLESQGRATVDDVGQDDRLHDTSQATDDPVLRQTQQPWHHGLPARSRMTVNGTSGTVSSERM